MASKDHDASKSLLDEVRERGVIRVAADWRDTPMQYLDPDTGEPAGMVGLVGELLARDLNVRAEFVELPWADHIAALLDDSVDISVKHTNTPQRAFEVEFTTQSIVCDEGRIVIRRDSGLRSEADLNQASRIIGVEIRSSQEVHVRDRYPLAQIRTFPYGRDRDIFEAVAAAEVDACLHDTGVPNFLLRHPKCTVLTADDGRPIVAYVDCIHPCIKPGDQRFLNWLNNWMAFRKAAGTFERILDEAEREHKAKLERIIAKARESW